ncbi:MAG: hypothetical protein AB1896_00610 [Thermodesulfobacteriota bacterium]
MPVFDRNSEKPEPLAGPNGEEGPPPDYYLESLETEDQRRARLLANAIFLVRLLGRLMSLAALILLWSYPPGWLWWAVAAVLVLEWWSARTVVRAESYNYPPPAIIFRRRAALVLTLACFLTAGIGLAVGLTRSDTGEDLPAQFHQDRDLFVRSLLDLNEARGLYLKFTLSGSRAGGPPDQGLEARAASLARTGLEAGDRVSDGFLDYVDPDLKTRFRENLLEGFRTWSEGARTGNMQATFDGHLLLGRWDAWWTVNKISLARRLKALELIKGSDSGS